MHYKILQGRSSDGEIQDILKQLIEEVQTVIKWVLPAIAEADVITSTKINPWLHLYSN